MATKENTSNTHDDNGQAVSFRQLELKLNNFGALLNGVSDICKSEDVEVDGRYVAATICDQINEELCRIADQLGKLATKGGAA